MTLADLPLLRDDVLYDAETVRRYVNCSLYRLKIRVRRDEVPHVHDGRAYRWNAPQIRRIVAGTPYKPGTCPVCRKAKAGAARH